MNTQTKPAGVPPKKLKMGEYLVKTGLIDEETLAKALELQKKQKKRLGQILVDMGLADDVIIAKTLGQTAQHSLRSAE